jgi:hypothetical protein
MMLLLHKASRKIRKNGLDLDYVQRWLLESCTAYASSAADSPHCYLLVMDADPEVDSAFAMAIIDKEDLVLAAGKGAKSAVGDFAAQAVKATPGRVIAFARERFTVEERELTIHRNDMRDWAPGPMPGPGFRGTAYSLAEAHEALEPAPLHTVDRTLAAILTRVASSNLVNLLTLRDIKEWLPRYLEEYEEGLKEHPDQRGEPHWNLLAADWRDDEDAVFCIALVDADRLRLAVGRGECNAVRDHGEDGRFDDARKIIALARTKFQVDDEELSIDGQRELYNWLEAA